ncbi:HD domain-containing protein [Paraburkholderia phosphatilytica]|uniref:HD domain-containing protein n=1 Tax=Paraburkholderia phosphatilytica TaxID=2282883 RepID=UPI000E549C24|nr:HD domain-containing protein [Paraburkholderia phosphatilytica]
MKDLATAASAFAHAAHGAAGQFRKYTGEPYIAHCATVAALVTQSSHASPETIAAAWLHDVVEDCPNIDAGMIEYFFGPTVAKLVTECSHIDRTNDPRKLNRFERMAIELARAADISPEAKTIKLADLIDNTSSIAVHDPKFAKVYMAEKRRLVNVLVGGDRALWAMAASQVANYFAVQPTNSVRVTPAAATVTLDGGQTFTVTGNLKFADVHTKAEQAETTAPDVVPASQSGLVNAATPHDPEKWYPGTQTPPKDGIYERKFADGSGTHLPYAKFAGGQWHPKCRTIDQTRSDTQASVWQFDNAGDEWRGPVAPLRDPNAWQKGEEKPTEIGVYQRRFGEGVSTIYSHWDGSRWGSYGPSAELAESYRYSSSGEQSLDWRGPVSAITDGSVRWN